MSARLDAHADRTDARFDGFGARIDALSDRIDARLDGIESRIYVHLERHAG
jgi:hypothetical protein